MLRSYAVGLAIAGLSFIVNCASAAFADRVESYNPGTGFAVSFSGVPYTNASAVLGAPNPNTSFGPVQPFNPPYEVSEIASVGKDGYMVLRFDSPVHNAPGNSFGLDFIIYGSAGFVDTDYPNGHTDSFASMFGNNTGTTRVSVSADNAVFYVLDPSLAPVVDALYPTDGSGQAGLPVNPSLTSSDFADKTLADIRALYANSAGGAGYDISWAQDGSGTPVHLDDIQYIRIDVLSGRAEIDAIAAVPEPRTWLIAVAGAAVCLIRGWRKRNRG